jgi:hypothetical protein
MAKTIFGRVEEIAAHQKKSLKEPCYALECSVAQLEERLNSLEPAAVEECAHWLGISYYSFFFTPEESAEARLRLLRQSRPGLWDPRHTG